MDVAKPDQIAAAMADAVNWLGGLDIAVNCAGIHRSSDPLKISEAEWDDVLNVNLKGAFFLCQAAGRAMADSGGGTIVNITSVMAEVALGDLAHYAASKGGVRQLTKALAVGLAGFNIRVNAVGPGPVESAMNADALATPALRHAVLARVAMRRPGRADEIAAAVAFLAADEAAFVTGTTLYVDGGLLAQR
jgi:NAD(P)-dependent dehydrogenase (short-subunit alcohol dehydrogenase family)